MAKNDGSQGKKINERYFVHALAHGLSVLEGFVSGFQGRTLVEIARTLGWTKTSAFRHLSTLVALGYLEMDKRSKRYRPTVKMFRLGSVYLSMLSVSELAMPTLERLHGKLGEPITMGVLDGSEIVYVARVGSDPLLSTNVGVGSRLPAHCTSAGKALLAWLDEERRRETMEQMRFDPHTPHTVTSASKLVEELQAVHARGFAICDQELEVGHRSCSAPVFGKGGEALAAINVSVPTAHASLGDLEARYAPAIVAAAKEITAKVKKRA